jgi:GNAT superfamily N-acetyltransferase
MSRPGPLGLELRRFEPADQPAVLELLEVALGWLPDEDHARFFRWKHLENPLGPSPAWVAVDPAASGRIVGYRAFLRWEFESGGGVVAAVRAVDTATHPGARGQGVFSQLTMAALDDLTAEGVSFVFNTPNHRSRPGYLKMGWRTVGRLPVLVRPRSPSSLLRLARARTPAGKWSVPCEAGVEVAEALSTVDGVSPPPGEGLATRRSVDHLRWRYGFEPLRYRAMAGDDGALVVFRLRRRGPAIEAVVCEELGPAREVGRLLRSVLTDTGADHAVRLGTASAGRHGFLPLPAQGPTLLWRVVAEGDPTGAAEPPRLRSWRLTLGDIELF